MNLLQRRPLLDHLVIFVLKKGDNLPVNPSIFASDTFVTLLGAGELKHADLTEALSIAPLLVAADGGANLAISHGVMPDLVVGDLDSLSERARSALPKDRIHLVVDQDITDFDKARDSIDARGVLAVGFTGARIDHELAVYHSLARRVDHKCIVIGGSDIAFLSPPQLTLCLPIGCRVSLFPLGPVGGLSTGLKWCIDGLAFSPAQKIGTSNEAIAEQVTLGFDAPAMLVILPRAQLSAAMTALF